VPALLRALTATTRLMLLHGGVSRPPPSRRTTHRWKKLRCPGSDGFSPTSRAASSAESEATITRTPCAVSAASTPPASSVDTHARTPLSRNMPTISTASARLPTTAAVTSCPIRRVCSGKDRTRLDSAQISASISRCTRLRVAGKTLATHASPLQTGCGRTRSGPGCETSRRPTGRRSTATKTSNIGGRSSRWRRGMA
jgi:hypothetical protein